MSTFVVLPVCNLNECLFQAQLPRVRRRRPGVVPNRVLEERQQLPLPEQLWWVRHEIARRVAHGSPRFGPRRHGAVPVVMMTTEVALLGMVNTMRPP